MEKRLLELLKLKNGNKELAIFYMPDYNEKEHWQILIGNQCKSVMLGEVSGEYEVEASTLDEAIDKMENVLLGE